MRVLVLDNYDSFTWNLVQSLEAQGASCIVHRSDRINLPAVRGLAPERIVISPGPFGPERTGICREVVREVSPTVPTLGVCLGMQVIASEAGARIRVSGRPVHGKTRRVTHEGSGVLRGLPSPLRVGLYHSLIVDTDSLPVGLEATAWSTDEATLMACRVADRPVEGVLFHPESFLTPEGDRLLGNFLVGSDAG